MTLGDGRVTVEGDAQGLGTQPVGVLADTCRRAGQTGGRVGRGKTEAVVTHDGWSLAWSTPGRHVATVATMAA